MAMLNYDAEIRKPAEIKSEFIRPRTVRDRLRLGEDLVNRWQDGRFDFSAYHDRYRQQVTEAIAVKKEGRRASAARGREEPEVINLMDALKRSIERGGRRRGTQRGRKISRRRRA